MRFFANQAVAAVALLSAGLSAAQTPPTTNPSTSVNLNAHYGATQVTPNELLAQSVVATQPSVGSNSTLTGEYMVMLVDLSIPQSSINTTGPQAPGLQTCRTTRLHWFQGNLTQSLNGTFIASGAAVADYGGPMPGLNDIAHTYTLYLFKQPSNFSLPAWDAGRNYNPISVYDRMNFSVSAIADQVGAPVAANYLRVQNPENNATGTASNGTCPFNTTTSGNATTTGGSPGATSTIAPYTGAAAQYAAYGPSAFAAGMVIFAFALF